MPFPPANNKPRTTNHELNAMPPSYHPQLSTNRPANVVVMPKEQFLNACVEGLQTLALKARARHTGILTPPSHRALLSSAAAHSKPFRVHPAPMPGGDAA